MIYLFGEILIWLLLAALLGLAIGWWIWGRWKSKFASLQRDMDAVRRQADEANSARARAEVAASAKVGSVSEDVGPLKARIATLEADLATARMAVGPAAATTTAPAMAPLMRAPAPTAQEKLPTFLAAPMGPPDDLRQLKGVGEKLNAVLTGLGVFHFRQIAAWTDADVALVDAKLEMFKGRIVRDKWVEQATLLAEGNIAAFEARFGKLDSEN
jgi:predicted flap endonuclease-1-like 5' DNA nuclease